MSKLSWLIERNSPAEYLQRESYGATYWTADAAQAMKFADKQTAQSFVDNTILASYGEIRICEHMFECGTVDDSPGPTEAKQEEP